MKKTTIIHLALLGLILIIAGVSVYRLVRWNSGKNSDREAEVEQVDPSEFDIEKLDMIIPMDSARLADHPDDGELNIMLIGNNPFTDDRSDTGLASLIAQKTDATVYDCAFPDSSTAYKNYPIDVNYPKDHFNLPSLANVLLAGEYKTLHSACRYMENPEEYETAISNIESVDMNKIDVMVIMYDSTDYNMGTPCDNSEVPDDVQAFTGGLRFFMNIVKQYWPHINIFVMTPTYAEYKDENGKTYSGSVKDAGNGTLPFYVQNEIDAAMDCGNSVIDNYYGTINESNYKDYLSDHKTLNDKGRELVADRIADAINHITVVNSTVSE